MISAITSLVAGVELVTELLSAAVLLMALDKLATAIRWTYKAGRFTGHLWYTYGVPAVLWTADKVSWLLAQIDWVEVVATIRWFFTSITAAIITVVTIAYEQAVAIRAMWVRWHDVQPVVQPPAVNPLAMIAEDLQSLTRKELMVMAGTKRRLNKHQLVSMMVAI